MPRRALNTAREKIRRQQEGARGGREGRELPTGAGLVDNLRSQVEQLEVGARSTTGGDRLRCWCFLRDTKYFVRSILYAMIRGARQTWG